MTSILTNTSAMNALQTLKNTNLNLNKTQQEIASGKTIASARDNAAVWAISKVMDSDVKGFQQIGNSLALGQSTIGVARNAAETVTDLLTDIKGLVVSAQEENVDREKIQTDIGRLREQVTAVVNAAQFNGLNLVKGTDAVNVLSSLDRASDGTVTPTNINIDRQDLSSTAGTNGIGTVGSQDRGGQMQTATGTPFPDTVASAAGNSISIQLANVWDDGETATITVAGQEVTYTSTADGTTSADARTAFLSQLNALGLEGLTFEAGDEADEILVTSTRAFEDVAVSVDQSSAAGTVEITEENGVDLASAETSLSVAQRAESIFFSETAAVEEGTTYQVTIGSADPVFYTAKRGDNFSDIANGLKIAIDGAGLEGITTKVSFEADGQAVLKIDNSGADATIAVAAGTGGTASGGLFGLDQIDVTSSVGAESALATVERLIQTAIDASASFGSAERRIDIQADFVSKLTDSFKAGISTLVDADMEEASARLQALQVQQQLGVQALSIANQSPQALLSLFR